MGVPDHFTCLLKNLYAGQEITVRKGHGTMNWFKIWKGLHQSCIVSLCLFKIYAEYIIQNVSWMNHKLESRLLKKYQQHQISNYTTLMAESEEKLKSLLIRVKERVK